MNILQNGLKLCGIEEDKINLISEKMENYINEIVLFNSAYNLTNTSDHDELVIRHILDSVSAYNPIKELTQKINNENLVIGDIGSGGGLPGIPLAACFPQYKFNLVERMSKRCAFLENCAAILGLKNVTVLNLEAEKVSPSSIDLAVFRAFRPLDKQMTKTLLNLTKQNGYLAAYKAKIDNIKTEMDSIKEIVEDYSVINLKVPYLEDSERNLVVINKK